MNYAPLVVFAYNRADKIQLVLDALNNNKYVEETDLFVFCDASNSKKENDSIKVNEVKSYLEEFKKESKFKHIMIRHALEHQGLAKSVISGVTEVINQYGTVIVTEDDLVAHHNYLEYMNECLNKYKDNQEIWSISGYTYPLKANANTTDVYFTYRGSSWGYATWSDRWNKVDWTMRDYLSLPLHPKRMHNLNLAGRDLWFMLRNQKKGNIDSWAVRWVFEQTRFKKLTVYPAISFLHNIGTDGSGTHGVSSGADRFTNLGDIAYQLTEIRLKKDVLNEFATHYKDPVFGMIQKY